MVSAIPRSFSIAPDPDPLVAPPTQSARRTRLIGDPLIVGAAEDEYLHETVEDCPVEHPVAVVPELHGEFLEYRDEGDFVGMDVAR